MKLKLTSKRQATFPVRVCRELGLHPGDEVELEPHSEGTDHYWILRRSSPPARPWLGTLRAYAVRAKGKHGLAAIRESIAQGRRAEAGSA